MKRKFVANTKLCHHRSPYWEYAVIKGQEFDCKEIDINYCVVDLGSHVGVFPKNLIEHISEPLDTRLFRVSFPTEIVGEVSEDNLVKLLKEKKKPAIVELLSYSVENKIEVLNVR